MISPEEFKKWYQNSDLDFVIGIGNQEFNSNADLWGGFGVYICRINGKKCNYWDINKDQFNPQYQVFRVYRKVFKNQYILLSSLKNSEINLAHINDEKSTNKLIQQLSGLIEYMNLVTVVRKKVLISYQKSINLRYGTHQEGFLWWKRLVPNEMIINERSKAGFRVTSLEKLLIEMENPAIDLGDADKVFMDRYVEIMSGRKS